MRLNTFIILLFICLEGFSQASAHNGAAKFAPADGQKLLILGQDLGAVGGLVSHPNGYVDNVEHVPAGVTTYAGISNLAGLKSQTNWGSGDVNAQAYIASPSFDNSCIAIGLFINGQLQNIIDGIRDIQIRSLANWIKDSERPIFLRIGYEFDGPWNGLDPDDYKEAWIHIVKVFGQEGVRNAAFVWQSAGINTANIDRWYPGDEYVNWVGYSHFDSSNPGQSIRDFAEEHNKPIMIAEAAPRRDLKVGDGVRDWDEWFAPLFTTINANDRIKALAYINVNWDIQPMWSGQGWGDSRIQVNDHIKTQWLVEVNQDKWLKAGSDLFETLNYQFWEEYVILGSEPNDDLDEIRFSKDKGFLRISLTSGDRLFNGQIFDLTGKLVWKGLSEDGIISIQESSILNEGILISLFTGDKVHRKKILFTE